MKDQPQNSEIETDITAEIEARMAALVLGEASDLEADQLQRLIDARPELAALKAQFEAVHGLLREVGTGEEAVHADQWKLPAEMRSNLLAVIEGKSPRLAEASPAINLAVAPGAIKSRTHWQHPRLIALLCVAGCLGMFALSGTFLLQSKTAPRETALALNRRFNVAADSSSVKDYAMPQFHGGTEFSATTQTLDSGLTDAPAAASPLLAIRESLGTEAAAPDAYYLNDNVQYFRNVVPAEPTIGESAVRAKSESTPASPAGPLAYDQKISDQPFAEGTEVKSPESDEVTSHLWSMQDGEQSNPDASFRYLADPKAALAEGKATDLAGVPKGRFDGGMGGGGMGGGYGGESRSWGAFGSGSGVSAGRELSALSQRSAGVRGDFNQPGLTQPEEGRSSELKYSNEPEGFSVDDLSRGREQFAKELSGGTSSLLSPSNQPQLSQEELEEKKLEDVAANNSAGRELLGDVAIPVVEDIDLVIIKGQGSVERTIAKEEETVAELQVGQATPDVRLQVEKGTPLLAGKPLEFFGTEKKKDAVALGLELQPAPVAAQPVQTQSSAEQLALGNVRRGESLHRLPELEAKSAGWFEGRAAFVPVDLKETKAAAEPFSTFSLHISNVSFQLAQAALAGGKWPEANQVRIEEFVNAFDYGDPLPSQHEKVACMVEQAIHPTLQQRNVMRVSLRTAATGRASHTPLRLTLVLDNSGSMERSDRQQSVRRAFALLAQQLAAQDQITLISFARRPRLLADKVSGDKSPQLLELIQNLPSEGGTNIEAALQLAFEKAREQQADGAQSRIILLTDGAVNLGDANPNSLSQLITTIRDSGIAFDAAGISAEGLNDEILEALARQGDGRYYLLDSNEAADDGFARQIAGALRPSAKNVKVQIEFNPQRVGHYKLLGFEKHLLKQEDFRNDQVDAAELAAAEAGVAVYQFEAKPDGEGDVGSVSVRFQDLATGQMVEHRWPIPYQADAPQLSQAAPALHCSYGSPVGREIARRCAR